MCILMSSLSSWQRVCLSLSSSFWYMLSCCLIRLACCQLTLLLCYSSYSSWRILLMAVESSLRQLVQVCSWSHSSSKHLKKSVSLVISYNRAALIPTVEFSPCRLPSQFCVSSDTAEGFSDALLAFLAQIRLMLTFYSFFPVPIKPKLTRISLLLTFYLYSGVLMNCTGLIDLRTSLGVAPRGWQFYYLLMPIEYIQALTHDPQRVRIIIIIQQAPMFNNYLEEDKQYECCTVIIPAGGGQGALLIGDFNSATDADNIRKYNIRTIITAATGLEHLEIPASVEHITYPLLDASTENIRKFFDQSSTQIRNGLKTGGVLVHCAAGISRSATLVIAYVMSTRRMGFKQAIAFVRANRNVRPNLGFERQLKMYEKQLNFSKQMQPVPERLNLKKTITDKMTQQRRTAYNRSSHLSRMFNQYLKFDPEPRTADESVRRKQVIGRRFPFPYSQSRPRNKKNFQVRAVGKQSFLVMGQAHGIKQGGAQQSIGYSQQIKPPLIQNHHKNALNNGWIKLSVKKPY